MLSVVHAELRWRGRTGTVTVGDAVVATVRRALLRERAEVDLDGACWVLATHRGEIIAADPTGAARHVARGEGLWRRRWHLELTGRPMRLERAGGRRWRLVEPSSAVTGEVRGRGFLRQFMEAELPDGTTVDVAVFVLWLADVFVRRASAAAAG